MRVLFLITMVSLVAACATNPAPLDPQAAVDFETGKRVYGLHCARCHGRDGKDETYPFIARLDGIGKRMSPAEILEATWATGFISPRLLTEEEQRGLAIYVASL